MTAPETWARARLGDTCDLVNGRAYKQPELLGKGKYQVIRVGNFFSSQKWYYSDLELEDAKYCNSGDLLYAWSASFGPKVWTGEKAIFHYHIWRVQLEQSVVDKMFLYHWFQWDKDNIKAEHGTGSTMIHVTKGDMEARPIALPPLAEQRRIVAKLDVLTACTTRARADLDRIPALAARYKQAVLAKAFSGELTADWRASNHQVAATVAEQDEARKLAWSNLPKRRGKYVVAEPADWTPERLKLPKTWRWASVDELVSMVQYGSSAKTSDDPSVPVLRMGNIVDGKLDLGKLKYLPEDHEEFPDLLLEDGDLLFNRTNSPELVGKTAVFRGIEGSTSFASYLIRLKSVNYHPELLSAYINSSFGRSWVATATSQQVGQANVNGSKLRGLGVPLLPFDEQLVIWKRIRSAFVEIDRLTAEAAAARRLLDKLDQATLARAFRGELVTQDPADEPANVLLDRIRIERASAPKVTRGRRKAVA